MHFRMRNSLQFKRSGKTLVGGKGRERVRSILEYARKFHHLMNCCLDSKCHHLYFPANSEMGQASSVCGPQAVCGTNGFHKYFMICLILLSEKTGKKERKNTGYIPRPKVVLGGRTQVYRWGEGQTEKSRKIRSASSQQDLGGVFKE